MTIIGQLNSGYFWGIGSISGVFQTGLLEYGGMNTLRVEVSTSARNAQIWPSPN
jgi:hypothetical protein